jgi:hypothetical protein
MSKAGYVSVTEAAVALAAATAKSVLGVSAPAQFGVDLKKWRIGFDGVTASAVPVLCELCYATFATNAPGTASTGIAETQVYGRSITAGFTAARNWTTEPTVLTPLEEFMLTPNGGLVFYDLPLGDTYDSAVSQGFVVRCTAPAVVNVRAGLLYERC